MKIGIAGSLLLALLILVGTLNNTSGAAKPLGLVALAGVLGIGSLVLVVYLSIRGRFSMQLKGPVVFAGLFLATYGVGVMQGVSVRALSVFAQVALVLCFFLAASLITWERKHLQVLGFVGAVFILLNAAWWIAMGAPNLFSSYLANPNTFGPLVYLLLFFVLHARRRSSHKKAWDVILFVGVLLIYASTARAVWLAAMVSLLTYVSWGVITKTRQRFRATLIAVFSGIAAWVVIYPRLPQMPFALQLNRLMFEYTGKQLLSGREDFWGFLVDAIRERIWIGYGAGTIPQDFTSTSLSSHNFYLQTALQVGVAGLALLIGLFWSIWEIFWQGRGLFSTRLSSAFLLGILVHQAFEVSLTQVSVAIGALQWLVIAIGVSKTIEAAQGERRQKLKRSHA